MAPAVNCNLTVFFILLLLIPPVLAAGGTSTVPLNTTQAQVQPAPYTVRLFIPTAHMIHSDQINDQINGPGGDVIFGTSFGLSTYNGTWSTRHLNLNNISEGLMDDYITAVEQDSAGNLWIGYSGGIQIYDGHYYHPIRDQQLLKETRIKDLQRWDDDMWIATGHAGIHRYRNGTWTWFQPMTKNGPGFYEINSMALDTMSNTLALATDQEGLWILRSPDDPAVFEQIAGRDSTYGLQRQVKPDPLGGVYFSNASTVVHYDPAHGFTPVVTTAGLTTADISLNDIAAGHDGKLYLATDDGIYVWENGVIVLHLSRFEGVGTSQVVKTVYCDAENRVWFSTPGYVGYYEDRAGAVPTIGIELVTPVPGVNSAAVITATVPPAPVAAVSAVPQDPAPFFPDDSILKILNPIIDPVVKALRAIGSRG
jgi:ligand-binding sensor domain-containing protein